jgi:peptide/nickel transport system substrate-binding protein
MWRIIRESSTKRIAMEAGEIQYADTLTPEDYEALGAGGFTLNTSRELTPFAIKLNNRVGPTADVNVRKALMHAMDYQAALDSVLGYGAIMQGPLSSDFQPWHKSDLVVPTFDMEAAKAALAQSQYPDGFDLEYVYVTGLAFEEQVGLILLENCLELGINVIMTPLVWPDMVARAATPETSPAAMAVYGGSNYLDPDNFLYAPYHSSQAGSWNAASHYSNPEVDALLEEGRSTIDQDRRKEIYDRVQEMLVRDCVEIWILNEVPLEAWDPAIVGEPYMPIMGGDIRTFGYGS